MVRSLTLSVVLFRFRSLNVVVVGVLVCVCSAWHPDTLPTHSSLKKTYMHFRRYIWNCTTVCDFIATRRLEVFLTSRCPRVTCLGRVETSTTATTALTTDCTGSCSSNRPGVAERPTAAPYSIQGVMRRSCQAATDTGGDHTQY